MGCALSNSSFLWVMTFFLVIAKFQVWGLSNIQIGKMDCTFSTQCAVDITGKNLISIRIITHYFYLDYKQLNFNQLQDATSIHNNESCSNWIYFSTTNMHSPYSVYVFVWYFLDVIGLQHNDFWTKISVWTIWKNSRTGSLLLLYLRNQNIIPVIWY